MCGLFGMTLPRHYPAGLLDRGDALTYLGELAEERGLDAAGVAARFLPGPDTLGSSTRPSFAQAEHVSLQSGDWLLDKCSGPFHRLGRSGWLADRLASAVTVLGHTRWATQGALDVANASPTAVGGLYGTHNGDVDIDTIPYRPGTNPSLDHRHRRPVRGAGDGPPPPGQHRTTDLDPVPDAGPCRVGLGRLRRHLRTALAGPGRVVAARRRSRRRRWPVVGVQPGLAASAQPDLRPAAARHHTVAGGDAHLGDPAPDDGPTHRCTPGSSPRSAPGISGSCPGRSGGTSPTTTGPTISPGCGTASSTRSCPASHGCRSGSRRARREQRHPDRLRRQQLGEHLSRRRMPTASWLRRLGPDPCADSADTSGVAVGDPPTRRIRPRERDGVGAARIPSSADPAAARHGRADRLAERTPGTADRQSSTRPSRPPCRPSPECPTTSSFTPRPAASPPAGCAHLPKGPNHDRALPRLGRPRTVPPPRSDPDL